MYTLFEAMALDPVVTPKFLRVDKCVGCGRCAIGCPAGAKWDTCELVDLAVQAGAKLITNCHVTAMQENGGRVTKITARRHGRTEAYAADLVVLAAGGLGSPRILENSGIPCNKTLFVDPVLCVAGALEKGGIEGRRINKSMAAGDHARMNEAIAQSREILRRLGVPAAQQLLGTLNAGHPGGMLPLRAEENDPLHSPRLPENLYVAEATILPRAMGNPPILTIMALAKRIARVIRAQFGG